MEKYAHRRSFRTSKAPLKRLVVLSECSDEYARHHLETDEVDGIRVEAMSWRDIARVADAARSEGSNAEKRLIQELLTYLGGRMTMQDPHSNWVYVVSLALGAPEGWGISWIDIVEKRSRYFHPVGGHGWPKEPPNYIAFRYDAHLQSIHHIEKYEVITNPHSRIPEIPDGEWEPHFLYTLGPAFGPPRSRVSTGNIYRNGRVRCMLDTLFTSKTISEARDISKRRAQQSA